MSTLLEQASLVLIPSGYKEDVVYSQIPTNGSGDLSFTRASNGTRINSAGLVEVCPWNLLEQSETFDNAYWAKYISAVTANATTAPNGTTTADKLEYTSASGVAVLYTTSAAFANGVYTLSCYAKTGNTNFLQIGFTLGTGDKIANFNLNTGVISTTSSGVTANIESVGNGWYRCIVSLTTDINTPNVFINSVNGASGEFIYIWGAQLNIGSTAKPYFPTTDRLNVPRLTYQNGGGGCPSLLLEKQSTNQIVYSQEMDNALWLKGQVSVTANDTNSPDGTQNADKVTNTNTTSIYLYQKSQVSATTWSYSFYAKKGTNKYLGISLCSETYQATSRYQPVFNLDDGTLQTINQSGSNETNTSYSINAVGNGWYKITASFTLSAGADFTFIVFSSSNNTSYNPASGNLDWQNATIGDYYIWGVQGEASSYPTSYIPTTSASATRVADACSKTTISSLIGQTEGTIFFDGVINGVGNTSTNIINSEKNTTCSFYVQRVTSSSQINAGFIFSGSTTAVVNGGTIAVGQRIKIGWAYKSGSNALYINGTLIDSNSTTFTPPSTFDDLFLNDDTTFFGYQEAIQFNQVAVFKTRLTNAELASLTTL